MIRILIADDHTVVRKGLKQILEEGFSGLLIEEVTNGEELMKKVASAPWDLVISDLSMPGRNGLDVLQEIKQSHPDLPVLILSIHSEDLYALRALRAGAAGYLNKVSAQDELVSVVQWVLSGKKYIPPSLAEKLATPGHDPSQLPHEQLSDREFEVFKLLAAGKSISHIGAAFLLSITTISTYRSRIMSKMKLQTNADLTRYAIAHGLL
jgi:two-component system invasion response regulator UvrY